MRGRHRSWSFVVSIALVVVLGLVGLWEGQRAGAQAESARRSDRVALQVTLAGLTSQYSQVAGAEMLDIVAAQRRTHVADWQGTVGSTVDSAHLRAVAAGTRALGAGAALLAATGQPLATYAPAGRQLPAPSDPGWTPLRAAVRSGRGTLPVSGVLKAGDVPVIAVAVPVEFSTGSTGLLVGLADLRTSALQRYVERLVNSDGRQGYVVDAGGLVISGPTAAEVGRPLRFPNVSRHVTSSTQGIADIREGGSTYTASYARAGDTGWFALTVQPTDQFLGPLRSASRRAQAALVLLLLIAGSALVVLQRKREQALRDAAISDELTGLYNRRGWFAIASHELERARRSGQRRGLLFIDVDGLKKVNDELGHREGDRAIAGAANVLRECARSSDVLGRLGGDEFVLLLGETGEPAAVRERVLAALETHNRGSGARFELRLSIGAEIWYPDAAATLDELVRRADTQMYADKSSRPGRHEGVVRPLPPGVIPNQEGHREVRK